METSKILFILKRRDDYNHEKHTHVGLSTGLFNSATFMSDMLKDCGFESNIAVVVDNNDIDRAVTKYKPTHVVIEALWVVPPKFSVLCTLHPTVKWIIRLHSEIPFLANEGMAFDWLGDYIGFENIIIGVNAPRALREVRYFLKSKLNCSDHVINKRVVYLSNYYPDTFSRKKFDRNKDFINVSCFGAIRPLKNHVLQALAAIKFADKIGKKLKFHINSGRIEQSGNSVLSNLKSIFTHLHANGHELINHEWAPRDEFLTICKTMDIGMQVSISETFNIVGADIISQGVPLVGSSEIPWANPLFNAKSVESERIYESLLLAYYLPNLNVASNQLFLKLYVNKTKKIWTKFFKAK